MKIYNDEEIKLINKIFDSISSTYNIKELSDLIEDYKELFNDNQKYAKEIERLNRTNNEIFKANETLAEEISVSDKITNEYDLNGHIVKVDVKRITKF